MIVGNIIKFGYGDISVGGWLQTLTFRQFKPPTECGTTVPDNVEFVSEKVSLYLSYNDYVELKDNLKEVEERRISEFTFKGYTFDFTNFNIESVNVCKRQLENAMESYFMCMAC